MKGSSFVWFCAALIATICVCGVLARENLASDEVVREQRIEKASPIGALALRSLVQNPYIDASRVEFNDGETGTSSQFRVDFSRVASCALEEEDLLFILALISVESKNRGPIRRRIEKRLYDLGLLEDPTIGPMQMRVSTINSILEEDGFSPEKIKEVIEQLEANPCDGIHLVAQHLDDIGGNTELPSTYDEFKRAVTAKYNGSTRTDSIYVQVVFEAEKLLRAFSLEDNNLQGQSTEQQHRSMFYANRYHQLFLLTGGGLLGADDESLEGCKAGKQVILSLNAGSADGLIEKFKLENRRRSLTVEALNKLEPVIGPKSVREVVPSFSRYVRIEDKKVIVPIPDSNVSNQDSQPLRAIILCKK